MDKKDLTTIQDLYAIMKDKAEFKVTIGEAYKLVQAHLWLKGQHDTLKSELDLQVAMGSTVVIENLVENKPTKTKSKRRRKK